MTDHPVTAPTQPLAISAQGIDVRYGQRSVLNQVDIAIAPGQVTALLGPNGAGKSTLLKVLTGEIRSQATVNLFGHAQQEWPAERLARHLGVLPQHSTLSFPFLVKEVVELGAIPLQLPRAQSAEIARHYMEKTQTVHLSTRLYPTLSGGEKQRVHLARVLTQLAHAGDQKILMLDEPTAALDLAQQHNTLALAHQIAEQDRAAVVVVLHDLNLAAQYAHRMVVLSQGHLAYDGAPWQVMTEQMIAQVYGYQALVCPHPSLDFPVMHAKISKQPPQPMAVK